MTNLYAAAGVNIEAGNEAVDRIKDKLKTTYTDAVLTGIGNFGSLYNIKKAIEGYEDPILVQSIDGVGTKLIIAEMMNKFDTVGMDIVNHSCNDIVAMGARPITFLDYVAHAKLIPEVMEKMVEGMVKACKDNKVALIGGETAEMPGVYLEGRHDIAGCITGIVDRKKVITGEKIVPGNKIFGFASNGLHTNGYSLARKLMFETAGYKHDTRIPELKQTVGETLLAPHLNYTNPIHALIEGNVSILGIAHITGGGFIDNIPRILPMTCDAIINRGSWPVLPIFGVMQKIGNVSEDEMYKVFNMGIGMVIVVDKGSVEAMNGIIKKFPDFQLYEIGEIKEKNKGVILK